MATSTDSTLPTQLAERPSPDGLAVLGCLLALGAFWLLGDLVGLVAGVVVALAVFAAGPLVGFAVGHVLLLVVTPAPTVLEVVLAELGLGVLLLAAITDAQATWTTRTLAALAFIGIAAFLVVLTELFEPLWAVTVVLVTTLGCCSYVMHRYELVALDLVSEATDE